MVCFFLYQTEHTENIDVIQVGKSVYQCLENIIVGKKTA